MQTTKKRDFVCAALAAASLMFGSSSVLAHDAPKQGSWRASPQDVCKGIVEAAKKDDFKTVQHWTSQWNRSGSGSSQGQSLSSSSGEGDMQSQEAGEAAKGEHGSGSPAMSELELDRRDNYSRQAQLHRDRVGTSEGKTGKDSLSSTQASSVSPGQDPIKETAKVPNQKELEKGFHEMHSKHMGALKSLTCGEQVVAGDHAFVTASGKDEKRLIPFVTENGQWRFDARTYMNFYRESMPSRIGG